MCRFSRKLADAADAWDRIGASNTVKQWITEGVHLPFAEDTSCEGFYVKPRILNSKESEFVSKELLKLEFIGTIQRVVQRPKCVSQIKFVPKKNGKLRLITDLRLLNEHLDSPHFQCEGINTASKLVKHGDYMCKTDLKDGFFHIPIYQPHQTYLGFEYNGTYYVWCALPFGLCCSPYFFNKCLRPIVTFLRAQGIRVVLYVDDCLIIARQSCIVDHRDFVLQTLQELGLVINFDKSQLEPSTRIEFLGYIIDTCSHTDGPWLYITARKIHKLKKDIRRALQAGCIQARLLAKIAGQAIAMAKAILPGKLRLRGLYSALQTRSSWGDKVTLDDRAKEDLSWWLQALDGWNGSPMTPRQVDCQIWTDASNSGWGATYDGLECSGSWGLDLCSKHINEKELQAVHLALKSFAFVLTDKCVQIMSDSATTVAYLNNLGGPKANLTQVAESVWATALQHNIDIIARHVPGVTNTQADYLSRISTRYEWMLHPGLFQQLDYLWGPHTIDRFASLITAQTSVYNSRYLDPETAGVDALAQTDWREHNNYVNPPFRMLGQVLQVICQQRATATVIAPLWQGQYWFPQLQSMLIAPPFHIPVSTRTIIKIGMDCPEPKKNKSWKLYAWRISGDPDYRVQDGQLEL